MHPVKIPNTSPLTLHCCVLLLNEVALFLEDIQDHTPVNLQRRELLPYYTFEKQIKWSVKAPVKGDYDFFSLMEECSRKVLSMGSNVAL